MFANVSLQMLQMIKKKKKSVLDYLKIKLDLEGKKKL